MMRREPHVDAQSFLSPLGGRNTLVGLRFDSVAEAEAAAAWLRQQRQAGLNPGPAELVSVAERFGVLKVVHGWPPLAKEAAGEPQLAEGARKLARRCRRGRPVKHLA